MKKKIFWSVFVPYLLLLISVSCIFFHYRNSYALILTKTSLRQSFQVFYNDAIYQIENYENYENRIKKMVSSYKTGTIFYPWLIRNNGEEVAVPEYKQEQDPHETASNSSVFLSYIRSNQPSGSVFRDNGYTYKFAEYKALGQTDLIIVMVADIPKGDMPATESALIITALAFFAAIGVGGALMIANSIANPIVTIIGYAASLFNGAAPEQPSFKDSDMNGLVYFLSGINSKKTVYVDEDRNSITHLHGSVMLEKELFESIDSKEQFAVCEVAINYFIAFMNRYGEHAADQLIRLTAACIESSCEKFGYSDKSVYHVDQNRFVFIAPPDKAVEIVKDLIKSFDSHASLLFDRSDIEKGYVLSKDHNGDLGSFPLACLICGIATNRFIQLIHPLQISHITNEILVYLSKRDYSCYMADRRKEDRTPYSAKQKNASSDEAAAN